MCPGDAGHSSAENECPFQEGTISSGPIGAAGSSIEVFFFGTGFFTQKAGIRGMINLQRT